MYAKSISVQNRKSCSILLPITQLYKGNKLINKNEIHLCSQKFVSKNIRAIDTYIKYKSKEQLLLTCREKNSTKWQTARTNIFRLQNGEMCRPIQLNWHVQFNCDGTVQLNQVEWDNYRWILWKSAFAGRENILRQTYNWLIDL